MMRCIAIDDEPFALMQMSAYIERTSFLQLAASCRSAREAAELLSSREIELLFVDINMPDLNGLDFVRSLQIKPLVIFTTAYPEYAVEGFRVNALDYLLKPIAYTDFLRSAEKALYQYRLIKGNAESVPPHIFVRSEYKSVKIEIHKITHIESRSEYVRIFSEDVKPVMTLGSLKSYEEKLPSEMFMRIHRSYIVNLSKVAAIERRHIVLKDKTAVPIGESYNKLLTDYLSVKLRVKSKNCNFIICI